MAQPTATNHSTDIQVEGDLEVDTDMIDLAEPTPKYTDKINVEQFEDKIRGGAPAFPISVPSRGDRSC